MPKRSGDKRGDISTSIETFPACFLWITLLEPALDQIAHGI